MPLPTSLVANSDLALSVCCASADQRCHFFDFKNVENECQDVLVLQSCDLKTVDRLMPIWCNVEHTSPDGSDDYLEVCKQMPASEFASCSPNSLPGYPFYTAEACCEQISLVGCIDSGCDVRSDDCMLPQKCVI